MESKNNGSFKGWNEVWKTENEKAQINQYFQEGEATTIFSFWQQGYATDLLNLIKGKGYTKFCELGSGRGTTSMYLSAAGYDDITMVDLADEGFEIAKISFPYYKLNTPKMILANVESTGLESESFDCIYNIGLLEHFEDPSLTLKETYRLLKSGGMIFMPILPTVSFGKLFILRLFFNPLALLKLCIIKILNLEKKAVDNGILRTNYNESFYLKICHGLGFRNINCIPYNPYYLVNDAGFIFNNFIFPAYKLHYKIFKRSKVITFKTKRKYFLLLTGIKN